uniref:Uncharacterized protein n=1 Tax=uncultured prokaryote TaxID=198431 RepID=A0A0H5Q3I4_9ZZZZ|nr:hypothetical protein [uncultured prokaryote]
MTAERSEFVRLACFTGAVSAAAEHTPEVAAFSTEWVRLYASAKERVGSLRASKVLAFIAEWQLAMDELGFGALGIEDFAEWSDESKATVYRHQASFRAAFPGHLTPTTLLAATA